MTKMRMCMTCDHRHPAGVACPKRLPAPAPDGTTATPTRCGCTG